jgi:hypothetical protein
MTNYEKVKHKLTNWCEQLKENNIYSQEDYQECVDNFFEIETGVSPDKSVKAMTDEAYSFGRYKNKLDDYNQAILSSLSDKITIKTSDGKYLTSFPNGEVKLLSLENINSLDNVVSASTEWIVKSFGVVEDKQTVQLISNYNFDYLTDKSQIKTRTDFYLGINNDIVRSDLSKQSNTTYWSVSTQDNFFILESLYKKNNKLSSGINNRITLIKELSDNNRLIIENILTNKEKELVDVSNFYKKKATLINNYINGVKEKYIELIKLKNIIEYEGYLNYIQNNNEKELNKNILMINKLFKDDLETFKKDLTKYQKILKDMETGDGDIDTGLVLGGSYKNQITGKVSINRKNKSKFLRSLLFQNLVNKKSGGSFF